MAEGPALGNIVKEGWLQKRGEHIRNWRDRYFILFDNGDLVGFKTQPERNNYRDPLNKFTVRGCQIMAIEKSKLFSFTIRGLQWTGIIERNFSVDTEKEREAWVSAIRYVADLMASGASGAGASECSMGVAGGSGLPQGAHGPVEDLSSVGISYKDPRRITLDKFEFVKVLGKGTFGKVVLSREKSSGKLYAMKILKKNLIIQKDEVAHTITENQVLKRTKHPFLTALKYSFQTADRVCFVMEYANGGELFFHLSRERNFTEDRTRFYGAEIVSALGYLHAEGIIYRDLKLENLLLDQDGHIKIADFGLCKVLFSLIMHEEVRFPRMLSPHARNLLAGLLTKEPTRRLGGGPSDAEEIKHHPFFACINWIDLLAKKIPVPFKPHVDNDVDTRYFDTEFTGESVELTPPDGDSAMRRQEEQFPQFSYQDNMSISSSTHSALSLARFDPLT